MKSRTQKFSTHPVSDLISNLNGLHCPHCQSAHYKKAGIDNKCQRYQCKKCGKNFRSTTNTSIAGLHKKQLVERYIQCMQKSLSLRKTARELGISLSTAFRWRHKLLSNHDQSVTHKNSISYAIHKTPFSQKGARNPEAGKPQVLKNILLFNYQGEIALQTISLNRKVYSISKLAMVYGSERRNSQNNGLPYNFLQQNINKQQTCAITDRVENWLSIFRGIASKYQQNYWNWFSTLQTLIRPQKKFLTHILSTSITS